MTTLGLIGLSLGVSIGFMTLVWVLSLIVRNASIVDVFWGIGFIAIGIIVFLLSAGDGLLSILVLVLVVVWGLRLAIHIGVRNWGKGEDWRYRKWRDEAGSAFWWRSYFKVFLLQGATMALVALPVTLSISGADRPGLRALQIAGVALWAVGFAFEAIGDEQLRRFKRNPTNAGNVMDRGLWHYTRHPNYFGESLIWWGFFLIAAPTQFGPWSVVSPALMTFLLVRVSGARMLESGLKSRKPAYAEYIRRTSAFIPWPPRRPKTESPS